MAISLTKGQGVSLNDAAPSVSEMFVGLGWDTKSEDHEADFDLDIFAFLLGANDKLISESHLIFYNNLISPDPGHSVEHLGDNETGVGEGDDEIIKINFKKVPGEIQKIVFAVTIYEAESRNQNFGQLKNAFVHLVNDKTQEEILRYELPDSNETTMVVAEIYRQNKGWTLKAVGSADQNGMEGLVNLYSPPPQGQKSKVVDQSGINWRYRIQQPRG
jgi:tellurium resistance protein TerD